MSDLITLKTQRNKNFSTICLSATEDPRLSWKAKGLHTYLISRPPGWVIRLADLLRRSLDGKASLLAGVAELKVNGFMRITRKKDEKGKYTGTLWEVYEVAQTVEGGQPHPYSDFPDVEKPEYGKSDHIIYTNTNHMTTTTGVAVVEEEKKRKRPLP